jgi:hypothetical protein
MNVSLTEFPVAQLNSGRFLAVITHILSFHVAITILCFGYTGNILAFLTMSFSKRSAAAFHFKSLSVADMLTSVVMVQQIILISSPGFFISWGQGFCTEYWFLGYFTYGFAYWCLATLTLDRVIAVCFPLRVVVLCTITRARMLLCANVFGHCVLYATNLWRDFYPPDPNNPSHFAMCRVPHQLPAWFPIFEEVKYQFFDVYLPPLIVLIGNVCIISTLRNNKKKATILKKTNERHEAGMTVMLISVSITFIVLAIPYPLDFLYWEVHNPNHNSPEWRSLSYTASSVLAQVNSSVNFYIYLLSSSQFRKDFRCLFHEGLFAFTRLTSNS